MTYEGSRSAQARQGEAGGAGRCRKRSGSGKIRKSGIKNPFPRFQGEGFEPERMSAATTQSGSYACIGCGTALETNPRIARMLAGSKGDPDTPHLCWVCARLHHSALQDLAVDAKFAWSPHN